MILSIEGNIGSGKTTLTQLLKEELEKNDNFIFISEPVDIWMNIKDNNGENILHKFYNDQKKYAFPFQIMAYFTRLFLIKEARKNNPNKIIITERSVHTDKNVFAKMLYDDNKIEDICYDIYTGWFDQFLEGIDIDKIVFVDTDPEICYRRILKRSREGEANISEEYLKNCDRYHRLWIDNHDQQHVLYLDGNDEFESDKELMSEWKEKIMKFINI